MQIRSNIIFLFIVFVICINHVEAQTDSSNQYYIKYTDKLHVSVYQSQKYFNLSVTPSKFSFSKKITQDYRANANNVTGFDIAYDKISFSLGFKSSPETDFRKGKTKYTNLALTVGSNKYQVETSYRRYKGFYDINSPDYNTIYRSPNPYYKQSKLQTDVFKIKGLYFINHKKFSYRSSYSCTYRQLKSSASFVITGGFYYSRLQTDSSIINQSLFDYFEGNKFLKYYRAVSVYAGAGVSANLVIAKGFFFNATFIINPELQLRRYKYAYIQNTSKLNLSYGLDSRISLGYNGKRFILTLSSFNDEEIFNGNKINITSRFVSVLFTIGYRFGIKEYGFIRKMKENKYYKKL